MIIVNMHGQLGNQMFQYVIYRKLQLMGKDVKFDMSAYLIHPEHNHLPVFGLPIRIASLKECQIERDEYRTYWDRFRRKFFGRRNNIISEIASDSYDYNPKIFDMERGFIDGYWQSEKYFDGVESVIRKEFVFPKSCNPKNIDVENQIKESMSVSIHVRRGDYIGGFPIQDMSYYAPAIDYFKRKYEDVRFFVFSNDIDWCRGAFVGPEYIFVDWNTGTDSYYDMHLMSLCKCNIIANSSYSWWGAWLNENPDKEVIAPRKWLFEVKNPDIYAEGWIVL